MSNDDWFDVPIPYFDGAGLEQVHHPEYVIWIDGMDSASVLQRSLNRAANFIAKFHSAVAFAATEGCRVYPVMDGAYVTAQERVQAVSFLEQAMGDPVEPLCQHQ